MDKIFMARVDLRVSSLAMLGNQTDKIVPKSKTKKGWTPPSAETSATGTKEIALYEKNRPTV